MHPVLSSVLEFDVKELNKEIDKTETRKIDSSHNGVLKKDIHCDLFGWLEHRML